MFFDHLPGAGYVCAHRGARALAPENTMMAVELAVELGADCWEMDVQKTADGQLVVFHDDVLTRTTDVEAHPEFADRAPWRTTDFTLDELRRLDAGAWFVSQDPFGTIAAGDVSPEECERMRGLRIPTLREALEFTRRHDFPMNIEIKDQIHSPGDLSIVSDILRLVRETGTQALVLISSFNHDYLAEMRRLDPGMPLSVLVEERHPENIVEYIGKFDALGYHPDVEIIDAELVRSLAGKGVRVSPFTVNDMDQALSLINDGCFAVITDYTHSLRRRLSTQGR